jgi:hypothetical protein
MKSGEREAYLPGSGNTEGSSNNGSGHGGFPLLMFFPSACILPFMLTVFLSVSCVFCLFFRPPLVAFFCGLLCFFEKKQGNESLLWFLLVPLPSFSSVSLRLLRSLFSTVSGSFVSPILFSWFCDPLSLVFSLSSFVFLPFQSLVFLSCSPRFFFSAVPPARLPLPRFL